MCINNVGTMLRSLHTVDHSSFPQVAIKIVSMAEAPAEYSRKFLPREILSLNATYKHMNIVRRPSPCLLSTPCPTPLLGTFLSLHGVISHPATKSFRPSLPQDDSAHGVLGGVC